MRGEYKDSGVQWPPPAIVTVVFSKNEFEQYYGESNIEIYSDNFKKYSDNYFADNFLVIVKVVEPSGSIGHKVEKIDENGNIFINRLIPKVGTGDVPIWDIIIELDNKFKDKKFQAVFVDVFLD